MSTPEKRLDDIRSAIPAQLEDAAKRIHIAVNLARAYGLEEAFEHEEAFYFACSASLELAAARLRRAGRLLSAGDRT